MVLNSATGHTNDAKDPRKKEAAGHPSGESKVFRFPSLNGAPLVECYFENVKTLYDAFKRGSSQTDQERGPCLGARSLVQGERTGPYEWETYRQVEERATHIGSGIAHLGYAASAVGIFSSNSIEWCLVDLACIRYRQISVPMYDTFGVEALNHIVHQTEMQVIAVTKDKLKYLPAIKSNSPCVRLVIVLDDASSSHGNASNSNNGHRDMGAYDDNYRASVNDVSIMSLQELENVGKQHPKAHIPPQPDDTYTICYTSGTTGLPKGVVLTHRNAIATVSCGCALSKAGIFPFPMEASRAVHYSYLPMAHIFERLACQFLFTVGGSIGIYSGNVTRLVEDLQALRPTFFIAVPRVLYRMYEKINETLQHKSFIVQKLFRVAMSSKLHRLHTSRTVTHPIWDTLVFNKVRDMLGGRIKCILCSSAPMNGDILDFLSLCYCCPIVEGWGMTEAFGGMTCSAPWDNVRQQVGYCGPNIELKLVDVPELNYYSTDQPWPRGEVCARGPSMFREYYREPSKTQEVIDADQWFHTGDVGSIDEQGRLRIVDRKKQIFKLSQGEYIAPEKLENIYAKAPFVSQIFVYGDSNENSLVAIVVPNQETLASHCNAHGIKAPTYCDLLQLPQVNQLILNAITVHSKTSGLAGFERVYALFLDAKPFDVESNLLTPTFKLKRPQLKAHYEQQLTALYTSLKASKK